MLLHWLSSKGPLILLAHELLASWGGSDTEDYDRACRVKDYLGAIEVGSACGLILGDEPLMICWSEISEKTGTVVRWRQAENETAMINSLIEIPKSIWASLSAQSLQPNS